MSGKESYREKLKRLSADIDEYIAKDLTRPEKLWLMLDIIRERVLHKAYLIDYIQYQFYGKRRRERNKFIVFGKLLEIMRICNHTEHRYIFDEKPEFNKKFAGYLGRDWLDMQQADYGEFQAFLAGKDRIFMKDPAGMFGKGAGLLYTKDITDPKIVYDRLKAAGVLCEEVFSQSRETAAFNETSANTMRLVTLVCADGTVRVMGGAIRIGRKGECADNFHHQGIAALIDVDTGIVKTTGVDRNFKRYVVHPDSGVPIVGFQVPEWEKIIRTVKEAALVIPDMRYIGWDVAINKEHEVLLIEGNTGADPDVMQIPDQTGKWPEFKPYLDEIQRAEN